MALVSFLSLWRLICSVVTVTVGQVETVCVWCGESFSYVPSKRGGVPPRYCRRSHRQRAYEARKADAVSNAPTSGSRKRQPRGGDPLGILPTIEQQVLTLSQARVGKRASMEGVRAAAEIEAALEQHALMVVLGAEREGTPFAEIAEALNMSEDDTRTWITATLGPEPDED